MNRSIKLFGLVVLFVFSVSKANAEIIDHGDYLTDTDSGLDWLDVTMSQGLSFDYVSSQFGIGGEYEGWRYATGAEFDTLVENATGAEIPDGARYYVHEEGAIDPLVSMLGSTIDYYYLQTYGVTYHEYNGREEGADLDYVYGFTSDTFGTARITAMLWDNDTIVNEEDRSYSHYFTSSPSSSYYDMGSFLVRDTVDVPEPSTIFLLGLGLLGLLGTRHYKA